MKVPLALAALLVAAATTSAFAQRGELAAHIDHETSPLDGFPGTFNAAMPAPNEWRVDVGLTPGLSYGIHEDASIRTSMYPLLSYALTSPGGSAELRYRMWHDQRFAVVGTFGGMFARFGKETAVEVRAIQASLTGEWRFTARSAVALTVLAGGLSVISESRLDDMTTTDVKAGGTLQGIGVMASYSVFPARWFGVDLGLGVAPRLDVAIVGTGGTTALDLDSVVEAGHGLGGRFVFYFKPGRTWLINVGAVVLPPVIPVPVLGVSKRW